MEFKFSLGEAVALSLSDEAGVVIGRAQYLNSCNSYYVRYKDALGRQVQSWIDEDAIVAVS